MRLAGSACDDALMGIVIIIPIMVNGLAKWLKETHAERERESSCSLLYVLIKGKSIGIVDSL